MDIALQLFTKPTEVQTLNSCRLHLQVTLLSNIMMTNGTTILTSVTNGLCPLSSTASQLFPYQLKPSKRGWRPWTKLIKKLTHTGTLTLKQPLGPCYYTGAQLHLKWLAMINPSTSTLYMNKPHGIEAHCVGILKIGAVAQEQSRRPIVFRWRSIGIDSANKPKTMETCCCMSQNIETCARGAGFKGDMFGKTKREE